MKEYVAKYKKLVDVDQFIDDIVYSVREIHQYNKEEAFKMIIQNQDESSEEITLSHGIIKSIEPEIKHKQEKTESALNTIYNTYVDIKVDHQIEKNIFKISKNEVNNINESKFFLQIFVSNTINRIIDLNSENLKKFDDTLNVDYFDDNKWKEFDSTVKDKIKSIYESFKAAFNLLLSKFYIESLLSIHRH